MKARSIRCSNRLASGLPGLSSRATTGRNTSLQRTLVRSIRGPALRRRAEKLPGGPVHRAHRIPARRRGRHLAAGSASDPAVSRCDARATAAVPATCWRRLALFGSHWKHGEFGGLNPNAPENKLSSFRPMDRILVNLTKTYPQLKRITLIGHSAGAQFVDRYSVLSSIAAKMPRVGLRF